ncbi:helix-turn-helix transcriptional regulator [Flagellimonas allohymeniacidonis]|uniref:XRE family transcriptional regulator n=1 Tax=Flagellimonas allohymeniacidonis TaxID=2517819 RepID=A0A4Q8QJQ0_9FLAO|nr:helix-turn-helix transcriptional regulator [Allomuricauda hymeniacidonis]TAI48719.1 XRE family transcriptional regulator [Allomuricauda hymeniacidonis]
MNEEFVVRLKRLLEHYDLTVSAFADSIGVQRSSMSHILNGRNRPSLDFIMKVVQTFPEVNLYWLLNGKGSFPSDSAEMESPTPNISEPSNLQQEKKQRLSLPLKDAKEVLRVVLFYSDGTFESFETKKH